MSESDSGEQRPGRTPSRELVDLVTGYWVSQAVVAAARLGVADQLTHRPRSVPDLARATGTQPAALHRLLRALASVGVFQEGEDGRFGLTPAAALLRSDTPGSLRSFAMLQEYQYQAWAEVMHSLRTGETAFARVFGKPLFGWLANNAEASAVFDAAMRGMTAQVSAAVASVYDFGRLGSVVDVGGGSGELLVRLLTAYPKLRGILFDQQHVAASAGGRIAAAGLQDRCEVRSGDFFEEVPPGADAYVLKWILHDWDDGDAVRVLTRCREAMDASARLLVVEAVLPAGNEFAPQKWVDLTMLVVTGGRERTQAEYEALLALAGLRLTSIAATDSEMSVLEAVPA